MGHIFNYPYCTFFFCDGNYGHMGHYGLHISFVMETGIWVTMPILGIEEFSESYHRKLTLWVAYLIFHSVALPSVIK